uniref:Uncharacterized protein n=1 Tax=viral metagenome TaxID=1070528 RepID=A0A6C0LD13_9ZZZZ
MPPQFPSFTPGQTLYLASNNVVLTSPNSGVANSSLTTCLPIYTSSTVTSEGLTILKTDGATQSLTISPDGTLSTSGNLITTGSGYITSATSINSNSINVGGTNFTVSSAGAVTAGSNLTVGGTATISGNVNIGSNFNVTSSTGALYTAGTITSASNLTIRDSTNSANKIVLGNDGNVSVQGSIASVGDINVNFGKLVLSAGNGNMSIAGSFASVSDVNVNSGRVVLSALNGNVTAVGSLTIGSAGQLVVSSAGTLSTSGSLNSVGVVSTADVNVGGKVILAASGNVTALGSLTVGSAGQHAVSATGVLTSTADINVNGSGSTQLNLKASDASVTTSYNGYIAPASATNTTYTTAALALTADPNFFTTATSNKLTTQSYVDKQIFNQTARLNLILDNNIADNLETFKNVFEICQKIEGSSASQGVDGLLKESSQIKESVTNVMTQAQNTFPINAVTSVWGTSCPPLPIPYTLTGLPTPAYTGDGWFFRNSTSGNQISWSIPVNTGMTLGKLQQFCMNVFAASNISLPQIVIKSSNATYNNTFTYKFTASGSSASANKNYCLFTKSSPLCYDANVVTSGTGEPINTYGFVPNPSEISAVLSLSYSSVSNNPSTSGTVSTGFSTYAASADLVTSITVQTDSAVVTTDNIQFILQSLYLVQASNGVVPAGDPVGTTQFLFNNASVVNNYLMQYWFKKHGDFSTNPNGAVEANYETVYSSLFASS